MTSTRSCVLSKPSLAQILALGASLVLSLSACGGAQKAGGERCCNSAKKEAPCPKGDSCTCPKCTSRHGASARGEDCHKEKKDCHKDGKDCGKDGNDCGKDGNDCGKDGKDCGKDGKDCGKDGKDCEKGAAGAGGAAPTTAGSASAEVALVLITAEALQRDVQAGTAGTVVDVNSKERYLQSHVAGAIHANHRALTRADLPEDLAGRLVFYCGSAKCTVSHDAARTALALGYTRVEVMSDGITGWEAKGLPTSKDGAPLPFGILSAADLQQKMQAAMQVHVFDVNSEERFRQGHVTGARHVSLAAFDKAALPPGKDAFVVFYCGSPKCGASHKAAKLAAARGYSNLWVMTDGIKGWEAAGLPTEK